jgi:hypothetical protein
VSLSLASEPCVSQGTQLCLSLQHLLVLICRLLDIVCLCMATLMPYSPSVISLLTDFRECEVEWEPLVKITFTAPALSFSRPSPTMSQEVVPSLTFGSLIAFANICTSALGKVSVCVTVFMYIILESSIVCIKYL